MLAYDVVSSTGTSLALDTQQVLDRICVRPPYFALTDMALEGRFFAATAAAEAPPYLERGPMPAAEVGRHAAIAGLCHVALSQPDDRRRYYLARRAECRYVPNASPYGTPVRLQTEVRSRSKREAQVAVAVTAAGQPFASLEISYTILTGPAFERLFSDRKQGTPNGCNPYQQLLQTSYARGDGWAEQVIDQMPASACAGHFDDYPALPVAVLMGQLAYLAGQVVAEGPSPFRVVHGQVEASDLCWAGERLRFRVERSEPQAAPYRFSCRAYASERPVGEMELWLELVR